MYITFEYEKQVKLELNQRGMFLSKFGVFAKGANHPVVDFLLIVCIEKLAFVDYLHTFFRLERRCAVVPSHKAYTAHKKIH